MINILKPLIMPRAKMKTCTISGKRFRANNDNFYTNRTYTDNLHPYHKKFDNYRRTTGASVAQVRQLVKLINS